MCRLLAYASREDVTLTELLGRRPLAQFTRLARKHAHGWGFAWAEQDRVRTVRHADPAHLSPEFAEVSRQHRTDLGLAHVRRATDGLAISTENTHPFSDGRMAMAHNGSITPAGSLDELVPEDLQGARQGTTDSERYALATFGAARLLGPAQALASTADLVAGGYEHTSVNAILLTDAELVAVSRYRPEAEAREREREYYHLRYRITPDAVIVASSGWGRGWRTLGNGEMLVVQRHSLATEIRRIDTEALVA